MKKHIFLIAAALAMGGAVRAQDWPDKPIRLIAPFMAGGGAERVIRSIANGLGQRLGQPVVVDYKTGAGGNIGAAELARTGSDGYAWMIGPESMVTINPFVYKRLGFEVKEIPAVTLVGGLAHVLVCNPALGVKSVADLVGIARTKPLQYASGGAGTASHLTMEMFLEMANVKMGHVPYRGPSQATSDLLAGHVDCSFAIQPTVADLVKAGRLTGLALSTKDRSVVLPDIPTMQESGFKDFDVPIYTVIYGSQRVPAKVRAKFESALKDVARTPEVQEAIHQSGLVATWTTAETAQSELQRKSKRFEVLLKQLNLSLD